MNYLERLIEKEIEERYKAKTSIEIDLMDLKSIKTMIDREKPVPPGKSGNYALLYCSCCDNLITKGDLYCSHCGQRIDTENVAL